MADPPSTYHLPASSDTVVMTTARIPHLPNEVLYVADEDILNLRLSAKVFHYVTADRFAVTFFEKRAYDMSTKGLKALVNITEHPSFARHIRSIVIGHGGKVSPTKHNNYLDQAFQNLAAIGNPISLGLRQVRKCRQYQRYRSAVLDDTVKFFRRKVLAAALQAGMPLGDFIADTQSASQNRMFPSVSDDWVWDATHRISYRAMYHGLFNRLIIHLSATESDHVLVHGLDRRLQVSQADTLEWQEYLTAAFQKRFREIVLEDCSVSSDCLLRMLRASRSTLRRLSLYNVRLKAPPDGPGTPGTWLSLFNIIRLYLLLESCTLGNLWDEANGYWLEGGDKTIEASTRAQVSAVFLNLAAGHRALTLDDR
ncbi:hypothetical protein E4T44_07863 [Aureobasidium sp. EXF-8845]|nr:hypothetical protein E4T44_07863 [Aureobasidium sp. EXF-8845]KAI4849264.1 hypothetical protein E4T45_05987 [Aureobasidium sp. EXF-8846]